MVAVRTKDGKASGAVMLSRSVVNDVFEKGISIFTDDALADDRYVGGESIVRQRIRSVMCAPMRTTDTILGVLYVDSQMAREFSEAELELLAAVGNQAGIALHRARLMEEVEKLFFDVMKAIASLIDAKDGYTHKHSERVAAFGVRLARHLGFDADSRAVVELSGLLHDVGKIGVPDAILNKPGKLTDEEFTQMRLHPVHGARILANIQSAKVVNILPGVKYHHERWDGKGYPEGLKGEEIPLLGRVLGVADFLDALTSDRSYRKGLALEEALNMVKDLEGKAFDPVVVKAAVELHERGELALPSTPIPTSPRSPLVATDRPPRADLDSPAVTLTSRLRAVTTSAAARGFRQPLDESAAVDSHLPFIGAAAECRHPLRPPRRNTIRDRLDDEHLRLRRSQMIQQHRRIVLLQFHYDDECRHRRRKSPAGTHVADACVTVRHPTPKPNDSFIVRALVERPSGCVSMPSSHQESDRWRRSSATAAPATPVPAAEDRPTVPAIGARRASSRTIC